MIMSVAGVRPRGGARVVSSPAAAGHQRPARAAVGRAKLRNLCAAACDELADPAGPGQIDPSRGPACLRPGVDRGPFGLYFLIFVTISLFERPYFPVPAAL